jgi:hypothetical protein
MGNPISDLKFPEDLAYHTETGKVVADPGLAGKTTVVEMGEVLVYVPVAAVINTVQLPPVAANANKQALIHVVVPNAAAGSVTIEDGNDGVGTTSLNITGIVVETWYWILNVAGKYFVSMTAHT